MKRIAFVISVLSISCTTALAQQDYFVFLQSDKQQPFYVRLHEKTWSSSAIGHLVLPRLGDSTYHLVVGFPKNQFPEKEFVIPMNHKDRAYQLKEMGEQGWVLFDEQTLEIKKPLRETVAAYNPELGERKTGGFATLMSSLVNDSSVMYKTLVKVDPPKPAVTPITVKTDSALVIKEEKQADSAVLASAIIPVDSAKQVGEALTVKTDSAKTDTLKMAAVTASVDTAVAIKKDSAATKPAPDTLALAKAPEPAPVRPVISKVKEREGEHGKEYIYVDSSAGSVDTIPVLIAFEKEPAKPVDSAMVVDQAKTKQADSLKNASVAVDSAIAVKTDALSPVVDSAKAITVTPKAPDPVVAKVDTAAAPANKGLVLFNSDCTNFATEQDVDKLRVKMLAAKNTDEGIATAKKVFKTKCFVTRYIKALSELFPNDEARFQFFETAYPFVSDTSSFKSLISLLSNDLYVARFKAMVRM